MANKKCCKHPGLDSVGTFLNQEYCQKCRDAQKQAVLNVPPHVVPKDCFITYGGGYVWRAFSGTGCAHWVCHEKKITGIGAASDRCLDGRAIRVADLFNLVRANEVQPLKVQVGNVWIARKGTDWTDPDHCGIVSKVEDVVDPQTKVKTQKITIKHDSSGQGKVAENDFDKYMKGKGKFYRYP